MFEYGIAEVRNGIVSDYVRWYAVRELAEAYGVMAFRQFVIMYYCDTGKAPEPWEL